MPVYPATYRKHLYATGTGLDGFDVAILSALAHLAGAARDGGWFTVTQKEIADRCGVERKTVVRRIPALESRGWIEVRTTVRNGHYQASAYRLHVPERYTDHVPERYTDHVPERYTDHVPESPSLSTSQVQQVRSYLRESDSQRPAAAENQTPSPRHWRDLPDPHPDTTGLLDDLGIIRKRRSSR